MSEYSNCKFCDKSVKVKSKKKHLNSESHQALTKSIISTYYNTNSNYLELVDIL